jgi:hypothetical protein
MPLIIPSNSISDGGYEVDNSLRFNSGSSDYLNKTFGTPTSRRIWTISVWVKRSTLGNNQPIISGSSSNNYMYFKTGSEFAIEEYSGGFQYRLEPTRLFRDVSAWYHIVVAFDTTLGTADDRIKLYVNGVQETSFTNRTNPSQNFDTNWNSASAVNQIGREASNYWGGYMSEVCIY